MTTKSSPFDIEKRELPMLINLFEVNNLVYTYKHFLSQYNENEWVQIKQSNQNHFVYSNNT